MIDVAVPQRSASPARPALRPPWWLDPAWLFAAVIGISMAAAVWQSNDAYQLYGTPKFLHFGHLAMAGGAIIALAIGRALGGRTGDVYSHSFQPDDRTLRKWFYVTTVLSLAGYAVWFAVGIKNGFGLNALRDFFSLSETGMAESFRDDVFPTVPGLTTFTQFGVAANILGVWLALRRVKGVLLPLAALLATAALRSLFFSERIALVELILPGLIVALRVGWLGRPAPFAARWWLAAAPLAGLTALVLMFGTFEYFRSWRYYEREFTSYSQFTVWRVCGYYTTAHNNGAMALEAQEPLPLPYGTLKTFWKFPLLDKTPLAYDKLTRVDPLELQDTTLRLHGTPELNNEGGLFQPALDFGLPGFFIFWFLYGAIGGRLYRSYLAGHLAGMTLYPLVFLSILEIPRYLYLSHPRSLPALALFVLIVFVARWPSTTARAASARGLIH